MRKLKIYVICMIMAVMFAGCGSKGISEEDLAEYVGGIKVVDLLDENSYEQNGDKMVEALENMLNASPNDIHMLEEKAKNLEAFFVNKAASYFEETFDDGECDYFYVGDMKSDKPHGYGVLATGYDVSSLEVCYIGEFKNGEVEGCYGVQLRTSGHDVVYIEKKGIMAYFGVLSAEETVRTYNFDELYVHFFETVDYKNMGLTDLQVAECLPCYIGELEGDQYSGEGVLYYPDGTIKYEGEFKNGKYNGKGKLYTSEGKLLKEGTFKRGELEDGEYYRENEESY